MRTNSVAFRLLMGTALWTTGALVVSGFVLAALFNEHVERSFDRRADILLESVIAAVELDRSGRPVLTRIPGEPRFTQPFSGLYWHVSKGGEIVLRSRSLWDEELREPDNDGESQLGRYELSGPQGQRLRVSGRGITLPGSSDAFRFAIASDVAEIDEALRPFNLTLGWSLGVLWLGLFGAVIIQVRFGLRPLRRIQAKLADVRRARAERLPVDFPIEVMPLVEELNAHLHQITQVIERARTHVGNLAHALKTPLTVLSNEATRAEGPLAETVQRQAEVMRRRVDHHLVRARTAATASVLGARTPLLPVVEDLRRTLLRIHAERSLQIEVHGGERLTFRGDRQDLEEIIGNVLDNGCK